VHRALANQKTRNTEHKYQSWSLSYFKYSIRLKKKINIYNKKKTLLRDLVDRADSCFLLYNLLITHYVAIFITEYNKSSTSTVTSCAYAELSFARFKKSIKETAMARK